MLCERCNQNNATLYINEYKNGEMKKAYICSDCANVQTNLSGIIQPGFENFLLGLLEMALGKNAQDSISKELESVTIVCSNCQMTVEEFRKNGRFGCASCYETFQEILENALKKIQPNNEHIGKVPGRLEPLISIKKETENLKKQLQDKLNLAIKEEKYEEAAKLRDQIRNLHKEGNEND